MVDEFRAAMANDPQLAQFAPGTVHKGTVERKLHGRFVVRLGPITGFLDEDNLGCAKSSSIW